jgi:hypothetical protein
MRWTSVFALFALAPVGLNVAAWGGTATLVPLCGEHGALHALVIDHRLPADPANDQRRDCAKGCHAGTHRKRALAVVPEE